MTNRLLLFIVVVLIQISFTFGQPGTAKEPLRYIGQPKTCDLTYHDGQLRPVVGTHHYQVVRANRTTPPEVGKLGYTYLHAPMMTYFKGNFYLEYLGHEWREHGMSTETFLTSSKDGEIWEAPRLIFPAIEYEEGKTTIAHQRMGFYVSPNERLLALAFYGIPIGDSFSPNKGIGIGRAVREIYGDGSLGPIHFIRYMPHAGYTEENTGQWYPSYKSSDDEGFVEACEALLNNKLMTQQWWEEDRSEDGFFALAGDSLAGFNCKALCFYHRKDGKVVGLWKDEWAALSDDEGKTWTTPVKINSKPTATAKEWGQKTDDGNYALVYNPMPKYFFRWPLAVITGEDGITYDNMLLVQGEVPPTRYAGVYKDRGQNYVRGIAEGNGNPPGDEMWVAYSMNKEDIWVSKIAVPITGKVDGPVDDNFENDNPLVKWNIYCPQWAPVTVEKVNGNSAIKLADKDLYDYAKAVRVFPQSKKGEVEFKVNPAQAEGGHLEIELMDKAGERAIRIIFDHGWSRLFIYDSKNTIVLPDYSADKWHQFKIKFDTGKQHYSINFNDGEFEGKARFFVPAESLERIEFRTGMYRGQNGYEHDHFIGKDSGLPFADQPQEEDVFFVDDFKMTPLE